MQQSAVAAAATEKKMEAVRVGYFLLTFGVRSEWNADLSIVCVLFFYVCVRMRAYPSLLVHILGHCAHVPGCGGMLDFQTRFRHSIITMNTHTYTLLSIGRYWGM